jgi:transcriptional regulator with XRE-family HTH domain
MSKSAFTAAHNVLVSALAQNRRDMKLQQVELAAKLGKDQSYISNIERGQRRVDVVEFYAIARAMDIDPIELFTQIIAKFPAAVDI